MLTIENKKSRIVHQKSHKLIITPKFLLLFVIRRNGMGKDVFSFHLLHKSEKEKMG